MKTHGIFSVVFAAAVIIFAPAASEANWTYNSTDKTITDGTWTLSVSADNANNLTIKNVTEPEYGANNLDLSTDVTDSGGVTPYTVVSIGPGAFNGKTNIVTIILPETLGIIGSESFRGCSALKTITPFLPGTVTNIGISAFHSCRALEGNIVITNAGLKQIADHAFESCSKLGGIEMANGLESVGHQTFYGCSSLSYIRFPDTLTDLKSDAYCFCSSVTSIVLSASLKSIGAQAFRGCSALKTITPFLPGTVTNIGVSAFHSDSALEGNIVITNAGLKQIADHAFESCSKLGGIEMADGLESVGHQTFYGCSSLSYIRFPDTLTDLKSEAYYSCSSVTSIVLSASLKSIGAQAFRGCSALKTITPFLPGTVTNIGVSAFCDCRALEGNIVVTNAELKEIQNNVFESCSKLNSIDLSAGIKRIGYQTFYDNDSLTNFYFRGDAPTFDEYIFSGIPEYTIRFWLPKNNESWKAFGQTNANPFVDLTAAEKTAYENTFPNEVLPYAKWDAPGSEKQWICGWIPPEDTLRTTVLMLQ